MALLVAAPRFDDENNLAAHDSQETTTAGPHNTGDGAPSLDAPPPVRPEAGTPIRRGDAERHAAPSRRGTPSPWATLLTLTVVLAGLYGVLHVLRRIKSGGSGSECDPIQVIGSRRLDAQATVHLVRIGGRVLAIGSSTAGLSTLDVVSDPDEIALRVHLGAPDHSETASCQSDVGHRRNGDPIRSTPAAASGNRLPQRAVAILRRRLG